MTMESRGPAAESRERPPSIRQSGLNACTKLYHLHIPKTAGTSVNHFIAMPFAAFEVNPDHFLRRSWEQFCDVCLQQDTDAGKAEDEQRLSERAFQIYDCVAGHYHFLQYLPAGTRVFSLLRDPISRLSSHVRDWNRIARVSDPGRLHTSLYECLRDNRMDVDYALRRSESDVDLCYQFRNHQAKCLLSSCYAADVLNGFDDARLHREACDVMDERLDLVGVATLPLSTVRRVCEMMGWPKPAQLSRLNRGDATGAPWGPGEEERLVRFNEVDRRLFQRVRKAWSGWVDAVVEPDEERANALRWLLGKEGDGQTEGEFTANDRVLGCGWHGRDAGGTIGCQIWSGPSPESFFYAILPGGKSGWLSVVLVPNDRLAPEMLRVSVDGDAAGPGRKASDGNAYVYSVRFSAGPERVARVEIQCGAMVSDEDDARPRGAALRGWRVDTSTVPSR
ncbi:MAG TPA: hypothetical protein VLV50_04320 [Stellaceae bacterium]|nr:hypothetical protein [Stellaceae bacterium]